MKKIVLSFLTLTAAVLISACSYRDNFLEPVYVDSEPSETADTASVSSSDVSSEEEENSAVSSEESSAVSSKENVSSKQEKEQDSSAVSSEESVSSKKEENSVVSSQRVTSEVSSVSSVSENFESELFDDKEYDIALITDKNGINSNTNLTLWKSLIAYGDTNRFSYKYYVESDSRSSEELVNVLLDKKAKAVVIPNDKYRNAVIDLQSDYSDVNFILLNAQPDREYGKNVHCVKFKEEQAGYLAGYLSILDGHTTLGFIGDGDNDKNRRYLYGMVLGADAATQELRLHGTSVKYSFINADDKKAKSTADKMYKNGVDIILSCNDNITKGTAQSAKNNKKKFICAGTPFDGDKSAAAFTFEYNIAEVLDYVIQNKIDDNLGWVSEENDKNLNLGLESGCVSVPTDKDSWHMKNVSADIYNEVAEKMISGELVVSDKVREQPPIAAIVYDEF